MPDEPDVPPVERHFPPAYLDHRARCLDEGVLAVPGRPVWVLANLGGWSVHVIVVEGDDGLLVFDTGVSLQQGELVAATIAELTDKPIRAIVYSHHHADHCQGTAALVTPDQLERGDVRIYAWHTFGREHRDENRVVGPIMGVRAAYMYGALLPPDDLAYTGLGGRFVGGAAGRLVEPTDLLDADTELEVAGIRVRLLLTGGEASTELALHLPDHGTVVLADEVYVSLPNLYTLRGAKFRDALAWARASERVLALPGVDVVLGTHMPPLVGRAEVERVLGTYADAIRFNHDQAVRHILRGARPDELRTGLVDIPPWLDLDPWTRPHYGHAGQNAAQQFTGYLGWFDGDATTLSPTPRPERARRTLALMGGRDRVAAEAARVLDDGDAQWSAELARLLVDDDPDDDRAMALLAAALRTLGYAETNALRRNYYLTAALELTGGVDPALTGAVARSVLFPASAPLATVAAGLAFVVDVDAAGDADVEVALHTPDRDEAVVLRLRNAVLRVDEPVAGGAEPRTASAAIDRSTLQDWLLGRRSWDDLAAAGAVALAGDVEAAHHLFRALDTRPVPLPLHRS